MSEQKQGPDPLCKRCDGTGEVGGDYGLTPHHCDCRASPKILSEQNVQVTQGDRDAAADLIELYWRRGCGVDRQMQNLADSIRAGHSAGPFPAAFARYRKALLNETATMTDYDAAGEAAFELGVPDVQGPRQQKILAKAFARHRTRAEPDLVEAAKRVLEWWPAPSEETSLAGKSYGGTFAADIQALRAAVTRADGEGV